MGRRSDIAGLAALAALGYGLLGNKKKAPVEDAKVEPSKPDMGEDYDREVARADRGPVAIGKEMPKAPTRPRIQADVQEKAGPKRDAGGKDMRGTSEAASLARNYKPRYNPSKDEQDYAQAQARARTPEGKAEIKRKIESAPDAVENVYPEQAFIGGPGLKGMHSAAKALAGTGKAATSGGRALATKGADEAIFLGRSAPRAMSEAERIGYESGKRIGYQEGQALGRSAPPAQLGAPARQLGAPRAEQALSEADWTGGAIGYKKGGSTRKAATSKKTSSKGSPIKAQQTPSAKGWGQARGARKAKIY